MIPAGNVDLHKRIKSFTWIQISLAGIPVSTRPEAANEEMESRRSGRNRYMDPSAKEFSR